MRQGEFSDNIYYRGIVDRYIEKVELKISTKESTNVTLEFFQLVSIWLM